PEVRGPLAAEIPHDVANGLRPARGLAAGVLGLDVDAVPADGPSHRPFVRPGPDDPDRDTRPLDRRRPEGHRAESVVTSLEGDRVVVEDAVPARAFGFGGESCDRLRIAGRDGEAELHQLTGAASPSTTSAPGRARRIPGEAITFQLRLPPPRTIRGRAMTAA